MEQKSQLNEQVDMLVAYKFIKILTTDFEDTNAFRLGVIDKDGNILKKRKDLRGDERTSYTIFHTLIWNLKKLMMKVPGLKSKLGSYASALFLLKEQYNKENNVGGELLAERILESLKDKFPDSDVLFECVFETPIESGVYIATQEIVTPSFETINEGEVIIIGNTKQALTEMSSVPLYTAVHLDSGEEVIVSKSSIEKIHENINTAPEIIASMAVFDVDSVPHDMIHGRKKFEKWNTDKFGSLDDNMKKAIRRYSYRNKGREIALRVKDGTITPFKKAYK
tara:strand:- start:512 stop:1354 length:843 start_codon:yes stop_codon:yes gene_type:complete